ncbi:C25 family cysteine peptidase [Anaerolineales bacterium HSG24]|nr:C25 family cysteine peptidase [Anaerolineales bacterium HSG24]
MKFQQFISISLVILLFAISGSTIAAQEEEAVEAGLQVLSMDEQSMIVALTVSDFEIKTITHAGQTYQQLVIPDMVQSSITGNPQTPIRGSWLGVPTTKGVSVKVIEQESETLPESYLLYPAPEVVVLGEVVLGEDENRVVTEQFSLNKNVYQTNKFFPNKLATIGDTGYIRDQAVAQLQFYPVQYNPKTGEVQLYHRIVAEVRWARSGRSSDGPSISPMYESVYQDTLLNYEWLNRPTMPKQAKQGDITIKPSQVEGKDRLKIFVEQDGLYKLTYDNIIAAGLDITNVSPTALSLFNGDQEIPIHVNTAADGLFASGDFFLFYGTGLKSSMYSEKNVYVLRTDSDNGLRMKLVDGTLADGTTVTTIHENIISAEEDVKYWRSMPNPKANEDHWFWEDRLSPNTSGLDKSRDYTIMLPNAVTNSSTEVTIRIYFKGFTDDQATSPNHHAKVYVNEQDVDSEGITWDGRDVEIYTLTLNDHSALVDGANTFRIEAPGGTGANLDQFFVNWIEVIYKASYKAVDNNLIFTPISYGKTQFEIPGFSTADIMVFNTTLARSVSLITNTVVEADGANFKVKFDSNSSPEQLYVATSSPLTFTQDSLKVDTPSDWKSTIHQADYIMITHGDFYSQTLALATHRQSTSELDIVVVDVEDIYDEFSAGVFTPQAIQDFLAYTYNSWQAPQPEAVLLVGDANLDYRYKRGNNPKNYVPTQLVETLKLGQTISDNWFVLVSGDDILPDMMLGRLPAQTPAEAEIMVNKIIDYDTNQKQQDWSNEILLIADEGINGEPDSSFDNLSDKIIDIVPASYKSNKVYISDYDDENATPPTTDIIKFIDDGVLMANYAGHGAVNLWGKWDLTNDTIFSVSHVESLNNGEQLPIVTVANCLSGDFAQPSKVDRPISMAEEFLRKEGKGSVAVWAPSGLDFPSGHLVLMEEFYSNIFQKDMYSLGEATNQAKLDAYGQNEFWKELVETFILFGDPTMTIGLPTNNPYLTETYPADGATQVSNTSPITVSFYKPVVTSSVKLLEKGVELNIPVTWNEDGNVVTFHSDQPFEYGQTVQLTVEAKDSIGNSLANNLVPNPWSFTVENQTPIESVAINGATTAFVKQATTFTATVSPAEANQPISYRWQATDQETVESSVNATTNQVNFTWQTPGEKVVTVTTTNANGSVNQVHQIAIPGKMSNLTPQTGGVVTYSQAGQPMVVVNMPAEATSTAFDRLTIALTQVPTNMSQHYNYAGRAFYIDAWNNNMPLEQVSFDKSVPITVHYNQADITGDMDENNLALFFYDEDKQEWLPANQTCSPASTPQLDTTNKTITVPVCHFTQFALFDANLQALETVVVEGFSFGNVEGAYEFTAKVTPDTAGLPITYLWETTDQSNKSTTVSNVEYIWTTTGTKTIKVTASNEQNNVVSEEFLFTVNTLPEGHLGRVTITGDSTGNLGQAYIFVANAAPLNATTPITYLWEVTDKKDVTRSGSFTDSISLTWDSVGTKRVNVYADNDNSSVNGEFIFVVKGNDNVYLPVVVK